MLSPALCDFLRCDAQRGAPFVSSFPRGRRTGSTINRQVWGSLSSCPGRKEEEGHEESMVRRHKAAASHVQVT